jgi:hypothetical protein
MHGRDQLARGFLVDRYRKPLAEYAMAPQEVELS